MAPGPILASSNSPMRRRWTLDPESISWPGRRQGRRISRARVYDLSRPLGSDPPSEAYEDGPGVASLTVSEAELPELGVDVEDPDQLPDAPCLFILTIMKTSASP